MPYFKNLAALRRMFVHAGFDVEVGTLNPELRKDRLEVDVGEEEPLMLYRAFREGNRLRIMKLGAPFDPDFLLVNNDFSLKPPELLSGLEQPLQPPVEAGWHSRRKSRHFEILHGLIDEFCAITRIDPWLFRAETRVVRDVDVHSEESRKRLAEVVGEVLEKTRRAYSQRNISEEPYVFLKDNSGTYGFAVMTARSSEDVLNWSSKERRSMASGKGKSRVDEILVQEGVPTKVLVNDCPAEPVIYLAAGEVIGGFFRRHCDQDETQSLNVRGMIFSLLTFSSPLETVCPKEAYRDDAALQVYGNLAKIAYLALGYEIQELKK